MRAPFVPAVFRFLLRPAPQEHPAQLLPIQVETYPRELGSARAEVASQTQTGRSWCLRWMKDPWLSRDHGDTEQEHSLSSPPRGALTGVEGLNQDRALISESPSVHHPGHAPARGRGSRPGPGAAHPWPWTISPASRRARAVGRRA
ncbi:DUF3375 family protein [Kocuria sabuli]|uniref:DUF3375 family protein n=1 Tax=Kocuria sabuli TaxID=3071448 RepID=UPI003F680ED2